MTRADPYFVQVYEMYVAGYQFKLLNNAFTSHWGFQVLFLNFRSVIFLMFVSFPRV